MSLAAWRHRRRGGSGIELSCEISLSIESRGRGHRIDIWRARDERIKRASQSINARKYETACLATCDESGKWRPALVENDVLIRRRPRKSGEIWR